MKGKIYHIPAKVALDFLMPRHYAGRKPQITTAWGWVIDGQLMAVCTFGKPASPSLCDGVCGKEYSQYVYELNRLCRHEDLKEQISQFVGAVLRRHITDYWIVVSYADTQMGHNGYIYQACNFIYTGATKERTDMMGEDGQHSRHAEQVEGVRKVRSSKHRYIYFCSPNRRHKNKMMGLLKYKVEPYPKGENRNYEYGERIKDSIVGDVSKVKIKIERDTLDMLWGDVK